MDGEMNFDVYMGNDKGCCSINGSFNLIKGKHYKKVVEYNILLQKGIGVL